MAIDVSETVNRFNNELKAWLDVSGVETFEITLLLPFNGKVNHGFVHLVRQSLVIMYVLRSLDRLPVHLI